MLKRPQISAYFLLLNTTLLRCLDTFKIIKFPLLTFQVELSLFHWRKQDRIYSSFSFSAKPAPLAPLAPRQRHAMPVGVFNWSPSHFISRKAGIELPTKTKKNYLLLCVQSHPFLFSSRPVRVRITSDLMGVIASPWSFVASWRRNAHFRLSEAFLSDDNLTTK